MKLKLALLSALLLTVLLTALLAACAERVSPRPAPDLPAPDLEVPTPPASALPELAPGVWTAFFPEGETICSDGSPYAFYVYPGTVNRVVEGGGACWNGATCGEGGPYQPRIPAPEGRAAGLSGLYDKTRPDNPVGDWYHVFVSYCTADVHLGDSVETYDTARGERTIYHNGQKNVAAVLDWVFASFAAPESVLVTGCSAGAYGAGLYTPKLADVYPDADLTQLGDCGAGIIPETFVEGGLGRWNIGAILPPGVDLGEGVPATFLADAYVEIGQTYPEVTLAQYNSLVDSVQITFYALQLGLEPSDPVVQEQVAEAWVTGLVASLGRIQAGLPSGFSSYTSLPDDNDTLRDGTLHCLIDRPEFYTLSAGGVSFVAWLDALINGDAPPAPVAPPPSALPPELPG